MKLTDKWRVKFYDNALATAFDYMNKLRGKVQVLLMKRSAVFIQYNEPEIECDDCKNEYFLGQVETKVDHNAIYWECPNCKTQNNMDPKLFDGKSYSD